MGPWSWPQVPAARSPLGYPNEGGNRLWTPSAPLPLRTCHPSSYPVHAPICPLTLRKSGFFPPQTTPPLAALAPWPRSSTGTLAVPFLPSR